MRMVLTDQVMEEIVKAVQSLRYGSVEILIHDSQVVQIERKEKVRFPIERTKTQINGSE